MKLVPFLLAACIAALLSPSARAQEPSFMVQGILIVASNQPGQTDAKVQPYEPVLKRLLRFESYRSAGEGSTALTVPGTSTVTLGPRHRLEIESLGADANRVRVRVKWIEDRKELANTTLRLVRGTPAVIGGPGVPGSQGEVYGVLLLVL
ncbi:hypothetical protein ASA1KI_28790 [Opitutales bacterium ASA1]|uniref:hypothetical protein n=1 Tax=Congregicoccus parvus TaxID=3081749 RepID=UPI002B2BE108|nr:hypothetical protein ASA1KI_28790 [Opitutales bacterium ASA1]